MSWSALVACHQLISIKQYLQWCPHNVVVNVCKSEWQNDDGGSDNDFT